MPSQMWLVKFLMHQMDCVIFIYIYSPPAWRAIHAWPRCILALFAHMHMHNVMCACMHAYTRLHGATCIRHTRRDESAHGIDGIDPCRWHTIREFGTGSELVLILPQAAPLSQSYLLSPQAVHAAVSTSVGRPDHTEKGRINRSDSCVAAVTAC